MTNHPERDFHHPPDIETSRRSSAGGSTWQWKERVTIKLEVAERVCLGAVLPRPSILPQLVIPSAHQALQT